MNRKALQAWVFFICLCFVFTGTACSPIVMPEIPVYASPSHDFNPEVTVQVDSKALSFDVPPQIIDGRTLVPLRTVFHALGATVEWDPVTQTVSSYKEDIEIILRIDTPFITVGQITTPLDVAPRIINGRTLIPLRAVAESFGCTVRWDSATYTVFIDTAYAEPSDSFHLNEVPPYAGAPYVIINENQPYFDSTEYSLNAFERYSPLDSLGRCGVAYANICPEIEPTEVRGAIGAVKPTGWHTVKYDFIDGKYLYNRCHLIGYQLSGENANPQNLITGTRYLNVVGMLPFENEVDDYVDMTGNHVLYRVTPVFRENNQLADGVLMEAYSVEDHGTGIQFCVFCYNVQPGVVIDYMTGESYAVDGSPSYTAGKVQYH